MKCSLISAKNNTYPVISKIFLSGEGLVKSISAFQACIAYQSSKAMNQSTESNLLCFKNETGKFDALFVKTIKKYV